LALALTQDGVAVIAASAEHSHTVFDRLIARGIDVAAAQAGQRLIALDASETLAKFFVDGRIDSKRFRASVGSVVADASERRAGGPVQIYGEMVAVLWRDGHVNAAIELERAWNHLGRHHEYSLLCGYPTSLIDSHHEADFLKVCRLHSSVSDIRPVDASHSLAPTIKAPRSARQFVVRRLEPFVSASQLDDMAVITSELATNAVCHAGSAFTVSVTGDPASSVRIAVSDADQRLPSSPRARDTDLSGRGLAIVAALSTRWGVDPAPDGEDGKTVWAEISTSHPSC
jgi:MEDS: MEthanogen/methylotroph, DcmR Sensory domain